MRILVVSKGSGTGAGESQATRYVARRKHEPSHAAQHEATQEATRLFSADADSLGHRRANLFLGDGQIPASRDVLHLVMSFAHEDDYLALGEDERERLDAVRELTRATLRSAIDNLYAADLRWVAGLHRNTDNPHLHLLIQRDYHDRVTGEAQRLQKVPSAWQVRWETIPTGARQTQPGELARTFERLLAERLEQAHTRSHPEHKTGPIDPRLVPRNPTHSADELARLSAQRSLAEARWQTAQQHAAQFAATRHWVRWEIPVKAEEPGATITTTLVATERALGRATDQAKIIGKWQVNWPVLWDDTRRAAAQMRVAELTAQREEIVRRIGVREAELAARMAGQRAWLEALSAEHRQATEEFKNTGLPLPPARFTAAELEEFDRLAARRGDADFYRTLTQLERQSDEQQYWGAAQPVRERASRALARSQMAEIAQREAQERLRNFHWKRDQTDVWVRTKDDDSPYTARLSDVQPRSRLARAFPSFTKQSAPYQRVLTALTEHEQRLTNELTRANEVRGVLETVAQAYAAELARLTPPQSLPAPRFTTAERERITEWLAKETDPMWQTRYGALLRTAEAHPPDSQSPSKTSEAESARTSPASAPVFVYDSLADKLPESTTALGHDAWPARESHFER